MSQTAIIRSRIEVAVHAEAERPVVLVGDNVGAGRLGAVSRQIDNAQWSICTLQPGVQHFQTNLERAADRPLGAQTNAPGLPIHVAARNRYGSGAGVNTDTSIAKHVVRVAV